MDGTHGSFKLAAYNLQNLGRDDNPGAVYDAKLAFLSGVLRDVDADIVAVAEIREEGSFGDLVRAVGYYPESYLSDLTTDRRRLQVGLMTRLPVLDRGQWYDFPAVLPGNCVQLARLKFRRAVPWLRVRLPDDSTLLACAVHLKSGRPEVECVPDSEGPRRREVLGSALAIVGRTYEAAGLRCRLDEAMAGAVADHYAVLGDFNDGPNSEQVQLIRGRTQGAAAAPSAFDAELLPVADLIPRERRVSYIGWGQREQLDHILVTRGLHARLSAAGIETGLINGAPRWEAAGGPSPGYPRSDHAPIWAVFDSPKGKEETS